MASLTICHAFIVSHGGPVFPSAYITFAQHLVTFFGLVRVISSNVALSKLTGKTEGMNLTGETAILFVLLYLCEVCTSRFGKKHAAFVLMTGSQNPVLSQYQASRRV